MGANASGEEGGALIENKRTPQIHLVFEVSIPEGTMLLQALTLAFWRFQGLAVPTLFTGVLQAIEARTQKETLVPGYRLVGLQSLRFERQLGLRYRARCRPCGSRQRAQRKRA